MKEIVIKLKGVQVNKGLIVQKSLGLRKVLEI